MDDQGEVAFVTPLMKRKPLSWKDRLKLPVAFAVSIAIWIFLFYGVWQTWIRE